MNCPRTTATSAHGTRDFLQSFKTQPTPKCILLPSYLSVTVRVIPVPTRTTSERKIHTILKSWGKVFVVFFACPRASDYRGSPMTQDDPFCHHSLVHPPSPQIFLFWYLLAMSSFYSSLSLTCPTHITSAE